MPRYNYSCSSSGESFDIHHSMTEVAQKCTLCDSSDIERNVCLSFSTPTKNTAGGLVKSFIEDTRQQINQEKRKLKEELYD